MGKHTCEFLLLHCADHRFQDEFNKWCRNQGIIGQYDLMSKAGAVFQLNNGQAAIVLDEMKELIEAHEIEQVIIMNHQDCLAYGTSNAFTNKENEFGHHQAELRQAQQTIQKKFPGIKVRKVFAHRDPKTEEIAIKDVA